MNTLGFRHDPSRCIGCKACQMACGDRADLEPGLFLRTVSATGKAPGGFASVTCRHCARPRCVAACPTGAMAKREDGMVVLDPDQCIGCRACMGVCPFGAPVYSRVTRLCHKCDSCGHRRRQGLLPACLAACPTGCLTLQSF